MFRGSTLKLLWIESVTPQQFSPLIPLGTHSYLSSPLIYALTLLLFLVHTSSALS